MTTIKEIGNNTWGAINWLDSTGVTTLGSATNSGAFTFGPSTGAVAHSILGTLSFNTTETAPAVNGFRRSSTNTLAFSTNSLDRVTLDTANFTSSLPVLIPAGTAAAPGLAFSADADGSGTGLYRSAVNTIAFSSNGSPVGSVDPTGAWSLGITSGSTTQTIHGPIDNKVSGVSYFQANGSSGLLLWDGAGSISSNQQTISRSAGSTTTFLTRGGTLPGIHRFDQQGTGVAGGVTQFQIILGSQTQLAGGGNAASTVMQISKDSATGRSINAAGTINASGADYAEYMTKSRISDTFIKGEVCGVDSKGQLTKLYSKSVSFVVKSTNPSYVGNDGWFTREKRKDEDDKDFQAEINSVRATVDRVAFCGQVPCIVHGGFNVGDYVVPEMDGAFIKAAAVSKDSITLEQYIKSIGQIWADLGSGKALVAVGLK